MKRFGPTLIAVSVTICLTSISTTDAREKSPSEKISPLDVLRRRSGADTDLLRLNKLIEQLGDRSFEQREVASSSLARLGPVALPALRMAIKSDDPETVRRATACLEEIEKAQAGFAPFEVVQQLLRQKPAGAIEALTHYLPYAADEAVEEAIYFGMSAWLEQDRHTVVVLVPALEDKLPARRALAGLLVARFGTAEQQSIARKKLIDPDPTVRLRVAQGFLGAGEKTGLPCLIRLLDSSSVEVSWQAEELLHYSAGRDSPSAVVGRGTLPERRKCRDAWERWWSVRGAALDLQLMRKDNRLPTLVLALENCGMALDQPREPIRTDAPLPHDPKEQAGARVWLCGCEGQPRCSPYTFAEFAVARLPQTSGRNVIASGMRVVNDLHKLGVIPRGMPGEWLDETGELGPQYVVRLGSNRLIAIEAPKLGEIHRLVEQDESGRCVWESAYIGHVGGIIVFPIVRAGFARRVAEVENLDSVEYRMKNLKDRDSILRALSLHSLRTAPQVDGTIIRAAVEALTDEQASVRRAAAAVVRESPRVSEVMPQLVRLLDEKDAFVRDAALMGLVKCGAAAIPVAESMCDRVKDFKRRADAAAIVTQQLTSNDPRIRSLVLRGFQDPVGEVRAAFVRGVLANGMFGDEGRQAVIGYMPKLLEALQDPDPTVVAECERSLVLVGKEASAAVPHFIECLARPEKRENAIHVLKVIGKRRPDVLRGLLELLTPDQDLAVCSAVAEALGSYGGDDAETKKIVSALRGLVKSQHGRAGSKSLEVQIEAIRALGNIGPRANDAVPDLCELAKTVKAVATSPATDALIALEQIDPAVARKIGDNFAAPRNPKAVDR
jgi:HEAT repeat protein